MESSETTSKTTYQQNSSSGNGENKIRKVLFNEVSFIFSICAVVIGVAFFITRPDAEMRQDIALEKQALTVIDDKLDKIIENELVHMNSKMEEQQRQTTEILQAIASMNALLEQHLRDTK